MIPPLAPTYPDAHTAGTSVPRSVGRHSSDAPALLAEFPLMGRGQGFLAGKRATTNPNAYDLLAPYCREVVKARIVPDGDVITADGVAASLDLGLYVAELL